jgi:hypothetical protein
LGETPECRKEVNGALGLGEDDEEVFQGGGPSLMLLDRAQGAQQLFSMKRTAASRCKSVLDSHSQVGSKSRLPPSTPKGLSVFPEPL